MVFSELGDGVAQFIDVSGGPGEPVVGDGESGRGIGKIDADGVGA